MEAIQIISQDLFDKIRSRFQNLEMGDKTGAVTLDPAEARFFDFDFILEGVNLGRVSISLNDLGSIKVYYSQGITEDQDDISKKLWYSFLKEMRMFAMRRLLRFDTRDIAKTNLDKNDFQYLASKGPKEENSMNMNESRWNHRSTKKTSRAVKGTTEVIVRHHSPVDEMFSGSRSRRNNIKAIFIQNKDGERFKYPFIHPAGAFAMAQHVDHGGIPHDPAGKAIISMSEQIAQLQEFQRQVQRASLHDDAMQIKERALGRLNELKQRVEALGKRKHYESWIAEFSETEHNDEILSELDPVTFEGYKAKFTQSSFNEELGKLFPLIHNIMQEKINLEEYVNENTDEVEEAEESTFESEFNKFEEWAEAVEQGKLTDDQIEELKTALGDLESSGQKLELGPNGTTAWQFFSEFGLTDPDLEEKLTNAADLDPNLDPMEVLQKWAEESYPELLVALGMSGQEPSAEPQAPDAAAPTAPAPEQPTVEGDEEHPGHFDKNEVIKEVAKIVKSFYNEDNPNVGPFRGEEGILIDVEKTIKEKFGENVGAQAKIMAEKFMNKLTMEWQQKHGQKIMGEKNELQRIQELVGNIKAKVESLSNKDVNEEPFDPSKIDPKKAEIPAYKRNHEYPVKQATDKAMADRNKKSGVNVWSSNRKESIEMEDILKLSGLAK